MKKIITIILLTGFCGISHGDEILGLNNTVAEFKEAYPDHEERLGLPNGTPLKLGESLYFTTKSETVNNYTFRGEHFYITLYTTDSGTPILMSVGPAVRPMIPDKVKIGRPFSVQGKEAFLKASIGDDKWIEPAEKADYHFSSGDHRYAVYEVRQPKTGFYEFSFTLYIGRSDT
jgi:hypothetical protein